MLNNISFFALFVFLTMQELYDTNDTMLNLAYRLLKKKGYLIMKTMDIKYSGKQYWIGNYIQNKAQEIGFRLEDMFILMSKTKVLSTGWHNQHSARKYHSYFFVFNTHSTRNACTPFPLLTGLVREVTEVSPTYTPTYQPFTLSKSSKTLLKVLEFLSMVNFIE
jgi:hypothetical protein